MPWKQDKQGSWGAHLALLSTHIAEHEILRCGINLEVLHIYVHQSLCVGKQHQLHCLPTHIRTNERSTSAMSRKIRRGLS